MVILPRRDWIPLAKMFPFVQGAPASQGNLHALGESIFKEYATALVQVGASIKADEVIIEFPLSSTLRIRRMGDPVFQIDDRFDKKFRVIGTTPEELRETKNTIGFAQYCPDQSQAQTLAGQLWAQWNYELQRCVRDLQWAVLCRQSPTGCFRLLPPDSWAHFELTDLRSGTLRASSGELAYSTHFVPLRWPEELAVIAEELAIFGSPEISATDELPTGPKEEPNDGTPQPAAAGILDPAAVKQHHTSREEKEYTPRLTAYMVENEPVLSKKKIRELTGGDRLSNAAFERSWDAANKATCKGFSSPGRRPSRGDFGAGAQSQETNSPANEK